MTARKYPFHSHWCDLLAFHLKRRRTTAQAFAASVGKSQQIVHSYLVGKTRPPLDDTPLFADKLGLSAFEREQFIEAAYESWTPEAIWLRLLTAEARAMPIQRPPDKLAEENNLLRASLKDCVSILIEIEDIFFKRNVPMERFHSTRAVLAVSIRRAIERYLAA